MKDSLDSCIHCGRPLTEEEKANATGFCDRPKCTEKA